MSLAALAQIIERASSDAAFRAQLHSSPESALAGYELTAEERTALASRDAGQLRALGVDVRVSKFGGDQAEQDAQMDWLKQWQ